MSDSRARRDDFATSRQAVADPPVRTRPPDTSLESSTRRAGWTECLIKNPVQVAGQAALRVETWVLRTEDFGDFQRQLRLRGFENANETSSLSCRERQIDPEIRCSECLRLLCGGHYGHLGVCVPAYPPQRDAVGCLALSKAIDMPAPATEEDDSGDWDGDQGRQSAFCNSVNVRFDKVFGGAKTAAAQHMHFAKSPGRLAREKSTHKRNSIAPHALQYFLFVHLFIDVACGSMLNIQLPRCSLVAD